ncbi:hypothetical protein C0995_012373 [Termitomyces sp. Mi166|nr:hypothetical protein C0995_012373 [Termitomyces sp. Mi166\
MHGARELQYDSYSESYYLSVPYQGRYVIRQDFGKRKGKGKTRNGNVTGKSMWSSMSQRHRITLDKELIMDSEVKFLPEGTEAKMWDLWSTLRLRLDAAMGKVQQHWEDGLTFI